MDIQTVKIGFIGCGNMAEAMIGGIVKSGLVSSNNIISSNPTEKKLHNINEKYKIVTTLDNKQVATFSDIVFLSVKPHLYSDVVSEVKNYLKQDCIVIAIAPGVTLEFMSKHLGDDKKVVRAMPNTPAMVSEGLTAVCSNNNVTKEELSVVTSIFESFGKAEILEERLMDVVPSISGSSPAYVFLFIEALADGAVLRGIPREKAYRMAAQAVLGAAKMVLETGKHPAELKDNVCSPGGTTIQAIYSLEKNNFRGTVIDAMECCTEKTIEMNK